MFKFDASHIHVTSNTANMKGKSSHRKTSRLLNLPSASPKSSFLPNKQQRAAREDPPTGQSKLKPKGSRTRLSNLATQIMPKPSSHRKKSTKHLRSRNWRSRDDTYANLSFSEDTIQRQLNYLVPSHDRRGCCWHECAWEGYVWCCGHTCWHESQKCDVDKTTQEEEEYFIQNKGAGEEASSNMAALDTSKCGNSEPCGCEGEEVVRHVEKEEEEKPVARPMRMLYRDEWDCDFCGPECFCDWVVKVEAFSEAM
jgi:hypothetical protein